MSFRVAENVFQRRRLNAAQNQHISVAKGGSTASENPTSTQSSIEQSAAASTQTNLTPVQRITSRRKALNKVLTQLKEVNASFEQAVGSFEDAPLTGETAKAAAPLYQKQGDIEVMYSAAKKQIDQAEALIPKNKRAKLLRQLIRPELLDQMEEKLERAPTAEELPRVQDAPNNLPAFIEGRKGIADRVVGLGKEVQAFNKRISGARQRLEATRGALPKPTQSDSETISGWKRAAQTTQAAIEQTALTDPLGALKHTSKVDTMTSNIEKLLEVEAQRAQLEALDLDSRPLNERRAQLDAQLDRARATSNPAQPELTKQLTMLGEQLEALRVEASETKEARELISDGPKRAEALESKLAHELANARWPDERTPELLLEQADHLLKGASAKLEGGAHQALKSAQQADRALKLAERRVQEALQAKERFAAMNTDLTVRSAELDERITEMPGGAERKLGPLQQEVSRDALLHGTSDPSHPRPDASFSDTKRLMIDTRGIAQRNLDKARAAYEEGRYLDAQKAIDQAQLQLEHAEVRANELEDGLARLSSATERREERLSALERAGQGQLQQANATLNALRPDGASDPFFANEVLDALERREMSVPDFSKRLLSSAQNGVEAARQLYEANHALMRSVAEHHNYRWRPVEGSQSALNALGAQLNGLQSQIDSGQMDPIQGRAQADAMLNQLLDWRGKTYRQSQENGVAAQELSRAAQAVAEARAWTQHRALHEEELAPLEQDLQALYAQMSQRSTAKMLETAGYDAAPGVLSLLTSMRHLRRGATRLTERVKKTLEAVQGEAPPAPDIEVARAERAAREQALQKALTGS